ncbi:Putative phosphoenolpyruvate synthase regulatory protein-like kinase/phosphatase [Candidatus Trichorickettsia mobilis]|uniref:Putative pyruvate, phosphate dikinase regulatory protein n=1 Tax=Candidatus Trichorickettsia mobilis TaxID=1346319 RepID=A0ABZ0UXQ1_9RICK|nr:pyruvate, water dikinase regulatory protein [Candidatus Trichorickettsia mobilis]WPY00854.1 Putative phosphoenolpyruvate synthase regulatory protein-like kinase/phosphatase [Candidatus Trichorickettsia mobilis]
MKKVIIHLISESSGQTVKYAAKSAISQFSDIKAKEYNWPLVRNKELLNEVLRKIQQKPGIVLYTISNPELRDILKKFCYKLRIPCISIVGKIVKEISTLLGIGAEDISMQNRTKLDASYFDKVNAIDYTLRHDDGQNIIGLNEADIILIGPSRTSKTPTAVYLAYNGFKTANVPYIYNSPFPEYLYQLNQRLIVGLVINPARLIEIREARMNLLQITEITDYTDLKIVQEECTQVKRMCQQKGWPVIDVSRRSIEETAAIIMKNFYDHKKYINKLEIE